jgi:hypothetical protein
VCVPFDLPQVLPPCVHTVATAAIVTPGAFRPDAPFDAPVLWERLGHGWNCHGRGPRLDDRASDGWLHGNARRWTSWRVGRGSAAPFLWRRDGSLAQRGGDDGRCGLFMHQAHGLHRPQRRRGAESLPNHQSLALGALTPFLLCRGYLGAPIIPRV